MGYNWQNRFKNEGQMTAAGIQEMQGVVEAIWDKYACTSANSGNVTCNTTSRSSCTSINSSQKATTACNDHYAGNECYVYRSTVYETNYSDNDPYDGGVCEGEGLVSVYMSDAQDGNTGYFSTVCYDATADTNWTVY